ncbi:hypothetical protein LJ656_21040 [Paraburkholderia sp. MMS20-SJTR3]|uniref:Uncharacterized protein n=1 Tax=Paraburkholderia sejongensis TaxID=2886946 RepID=A0ABS8JYW4_9BURK|nr:hypothetical protein [Paraburkholderia sp. MMS20-SJTR3]MCC8395080.1 hypothetical protein [Paraburkholderia sp. MMS20-SJTR3]
MAGKQAVGAPMTKACLTTHGGASRDMDQRIQQNLETHGVTVLTTPQCDRNTDGVDMTVTYNDKWWWDIVMYMKEVDIHFYTAPVGKLIVSGEWHNSVLHQFPSADGVVANLMDQMFNEASGGAVRTATAAK